jgi:hypothetical protein
MVRRIFSLVLAGGLFACEATAPPEIAGESVSTAKVSPEGAEIEVTLSVYNPNRSNTLSTNGIDSKVTIGGRANVARAVVVDPLVLPAGQRIKRKMPIRVEWLDRAALAALAEAKQPADYVVEGVVHFAGKSGVLQTPFTVKGQMTAAEIAQAAGAAKPAGK